MRLYLGQGGSGFMQAGLGSNLNVGDGGRFWVKLRADMDFSKSMMPTEGLAHSLDSGSVVSMHYDLGKVEDGSEGGISAGSDTKVTSDLALDVPRLAKACQYLRSVKSDKGKSQADRAAVIAPSLLGI